MRFVDSKLSVTPTDLSNFLSCRHRNALELSVADGARKRPVWNEPLTETLAELGKNHEAAYIETLKSQGRSIEDLSDVMNRELAVQRTEEAMKGGVDIIAQAGLANGDWFGRPDVLLKTLSRASKFGEWSYEPVDAKLARETRGGAILQLGVYCDLLSFAQGCAPEWFYVVGPGQGGKEHDLRPYRFSEYAAYFRLMRAKMEETLDKPHEDLEQIFEAEPVEHCSVCPWSQHCKEWWKSVDHLSLVAGLSRNQRRELSEQGVSTVAELSALQSPLPFKPQRGSIAGLERARDQARVQVASRGKSRPVYEFVAASGSSESEEPTGLARLPAPSPGDIFFDLEGDPMAGDKVREYLFGLVTIEADGSEKYHCWWATNRHEERLGFEAVMDFISERLETYQELHIYHYASYEETALKRLMGRYATRMDELDRLLRGKRLVDLYAVVRHGLRVGVERYSLKNLEPLYDLEREVELPKASRALALMEQALELGRVEQITPELKEVVRLYNRDDCVSTRRLRDWLEERRTELIQSGVDVKRPEQPDDSPSEEIDERDQEVEALRSRLLDGVSEERDERSDEEQARYQLAYLLDWHRREEKANAWEDFRLEKLDVEELQDERKAVTFSKFENVVGFKGRRQICSYRYPYQEIDLRIGDKLRLNHRQPDTKKKIYFGTVVSHSREDCILELAMAASLQPSEPEALLVDNYIPPGKMSQVILHFGYQTADAGSLNRLPRGCQRALLLRETPCLIEGRFSPPIGTRKESVADYAARIVTKLDGTVLPIQGPPGAGKTYTGARMITAAVKAGLKVGITATSHKVINNLLQAVAREAESAGVKVKLGHKVSSSSSDDETDGEVTFFEDNGRALAALRAREVQVLGGTAWLWAREDFEASVDLLFVDEAGQVSLANTLAVAQCAASLVLLGDPQQLEQPSKGSHPDDVGISALQHILGEAETIPPDRGLFLSVTWRLHPSICAFTSELFYAGQLRSKEGLDRQAILGGAFEGSGLWLCEVEHDGNTSSSDEEAEEVVRIVTQLLSPGVRWRDQQGEERPMTPSDIRIVAPFNAHVNKIQERLRQAALDDVPTGTVDKFQGQEAPVSIYSMATSHPEDAPRGMEFLYSLNRLNVATSRARYAAIVVASPRLFEPECHTPEQMRWANALCRFREMAWVSSAQ